MFVQNIQIRRAHSYVSDDCDWGKFDKQHCAKTVPSVWVVQGSRCYRRGLRRGTPCICIPKGPNRENNKQQRWNVAMIHDFKESKIL
jgi:hypothetical protein